MKTQFKKARTRAQIEADPRVEEIWNEGEDGWWAMLRPGWVVATYEVHCIHEYTIEGVCDKLNDYVTPCDCEQSCKTKEVK